MGIHLSDNHITVPSLSREGEEGTNKESMKQEDNPEIMYEILDFFGIGDEDLYELNR